MNLGFTNKRKNYHFPRTAQVTSMDCYLIQKFIIYVPTANMSIDPEGSYIINKKNLNLLVMITQAIPLGRFREL